MTGVPQNIDPAGGEVEPDFLDLFGSVPAADRAVARATSAAIAASIRSSLGTWWEQGTLPRAVFPTLGAAGALGAATPEAYGGQGLGGKAYGLVMQALEASDSGLRSAISVQGALVQYPILTYGSEVQKQRWLPALASGEAVGGFALTEPGYGSDPAGMESVARVDGTGFVLDGVKRWVTNGPYADIVIVWARLDGRVRGFVVPTDSPGLTIVTLQNKLSLRVSETAELHMQSCRVGAEALLPEAQGLRAPLSCLMQARYGIGWGAIGAASECYRIARAYTLERVQFGRPLAANQLIQQKLADMLSWITEMQLLMVRLAECKDAGTLTTQQVSLAKRDNVRKALQIARLARDMLGANGVLEEYRVMRHMVNLETVNSYEGTHDIHTLILGQTITGLDAFRGA